MSRLITLVVGLGLAPCLGRADTHIDTFDVMPQGNWTFWAPYERIEPEGGNPGAFLHAWGIDAIYPIVGTPPYNGGVFTGDYFNRMVTSIGVDADLIYVDWPNVGNRPMTLMLVTDNGTPANGDDDWAAYYKGPNIPFMEQGWLSYDYEIPYDSPVFPPGWQVFEIGYNVPQEPDWGVLMRNVVSVEFWWGDPELFYIFQMWDVGIDNARITWIPEPAALGLLALGGAGLVRRR